MRTLSAVLCVLALGSASAPALAAPPWTAPAPFGAERPQVFGPSFSFFPDGRLFASWAYETVTEGVTFASRGVIAIRQADGTVAERAQGPGFLLAAPYGSGEAFVMSARHGSGPRYTLRVSSGPVLGARTTQTLGTFTAYDFPVVDLAVAPNGLALALWATERKDGAELRGAWRRPGGRFGRSFVVTRSDLVEDFTAKLTPEGRALVLLGRDNGDRSDGIVALRGTPAGGFGSPRRIGPHLGFSIIAAQVLDDGREVVVWGTQDGGIEAGRPWVVRAAQRAPGASRFRSLGRLDPGGRPGRPESGIGLVRSGADMVAAWQGVSGEFGDQRVRTARWRIGAAGFGAAQTLAPAGRLSALDAAPDGTVVAAWAVFEPDQRRNVRAEAAFRAPGATGFGAPETVVEGEGDSLGLAFDPADGSLLGLLRQSAGRIGLTTRPRP
jgi:hypothetical protein